MYSPDTMSKENAKIVSKIKLINLNVNCTDRLATLIIHWLADAPTNQPTNKPFNQRTK